MNLDFEDTLYIFNSRELNIKTNNYIITDLDVFSRHKLLAGINLEVPVSYIGDFTYFDSNLSTMKNVFIDLQNIQVSDILSCSLEKLGISREITFDSATQLFKFRGILRENGICVSIIIFNSELLNGENRKLLNELYTLNTSFFNVNELLMSRFLSSTETLNGKMLDDRENYTRIRIIK